MGKEQQEEFEEIKRRLVKAPLLHMPNCKGRFHLYSEVSLPQKAFYIKFRMEN